MPKINKKRNAKGSRSQPYSGFNQYAPISRVVGRNVPFKITQATSGTGCISNNNTGPTLSNVNTVPLTPYTLGSRCALISAEFAQWRVRRMAVQYETDATASGVVNTQSGPSTTPSYGSRPFALGWNRDPDITFSTHPAIVEAGGLSHNTSRDSPVIRLPRSGWLYTSTTTGYPGSGIDLRMCAHGNLLASYVDASTTATATYGRIIISYDIEFRYPQNSSVIGAALSLKDKNNKNEQKEPEEKKINNSQAGSIASSWFGS